MKLKILTLLLIGSLLIMASTNVVAQGPPVDKGNNNFTVDTGNIVVKVTGGGNVPFYTFWASQDNTTIYRLQFKMVFEAIDNNTNGIYDLGEKKVPGSNMALAPLAWEFSDVISDDEGSHFNLSSNDGTFVFSNHIGNDATSLKFDVIINNYTFDSDESMLVLAFSLTMNDASIDDEQVEDQGNTQQIAFEDAFFEIEETATDDNGDVSVGLSTGSEEGDTMAYINYEQFSGQLVHDPTIGVQDSGVGNSVTDQTTVVQIIWPHEISKAALVLSTLVATLMVVMIPIVIYRKKTK